MVRSRRAVTTDIDDRLPSLCLSIFALSLCPFLPCLLLLSSLACFLFPLLLIPTFGFLISSLRYPLLYSFRSSRLLAFFAWSLSSANFLLAHDFLKAMLGDSTGLFGVNFFGGYT